MSIRSDRHRASEFARLPLGVARSRLGRSSGQLERPTKSAPAWLNRGRVLPINRRSEHSLFALKNGEHLEMRRLRKHIEPLNLRQSQPKVLEEMRITLPRRKIAGYVDNPGRLRK